MTLFCKCYFLHPNLEPTKQKDATDKLDEALQSDQTVGYIVTGESAENFDSSDEEPLSKYVVKRSNSPEFDNNSDNQATSSSLPTNASAASTERRRGRPKGRAKPKTDKYMSQFRVVQRHVRRDRIDEECASKGIVYKKWEPLDPDQESHPSVRDVNDETIVPEEQNIPDWCILCPRNKHM